MSKLGIAKAGAIVLIVFACHSPAIHGDWLFDDDDLIRDNRLIQSSAGLWQIWFSTQPIDYFPVTYTALWLQWQAWGPSTTGYHAVNLLLHAFTSLLAWRLLKDLQLPGAWTIALLFAVHPVNVETAAWMFQQKTTLAALFGFASLVCYFRFDDSRLKRWYAASLVLFILAMLAKPSVVALPLALLIGCWWRRRTISRADVLASLPYFAIAILLGLLASWFQFHRGINGAIVRDDGLSGRLASIGWVVWFYLYKAVWPVSLCFVYPRWQIDGGSWLAHLPNAALLLAAAISWRLRHSWGRAALAALAFYFAALLPVSGIHDISYMRYSLVADHWQYLALIAPLALIVGGGFHLACRHSVPVQRGWCASVVAAVITCATLSWSEAHHYRDPTALWTTVLERNPQAWVAHNNLGNVHSARKDYAQAESRFQEAFRLQPNDPIIVSNLALALLNLKKLDEASQLITRYLAVNQTHEKFWYLQGYLHWLKHEDPQAVDSLEQAIGLKPTAKAHEVLGHVLARLGDDRQAEAQFQQALQLDDHSTGAQLGLARLCIARRQIARAADHVQSALAIDPRDVDALVMQSNLLVEDQQPSAAIELLQSASNAQPDAAALEAALGERLAAVGRHRDALTHLQRALQLDPKLAETHAVLGDLHSSHGRISEATDHFQQAVTLAPHLLEARKSLGGLLAAQGRTDEAITQYRAALNARPEWPAVATSLAWLLATRENPSPGDQAESLRLALAACRQTQMQHPVALDTLAAAYAANGQLDQAAATAQQARDRALAMGQAAFAQEVQKRLDDYNTRSARLTR